MRYIGSMGATILVVEDNHATRELLVMVLTHAGFNIIEANDGREAVQEANVSHPDLILMDLGLPSMSGDEATKQIKSNPHTGNIPIVISTAFDSDAEPIKRAVAAGADRFCSNRRILNR